MIPFRISGLVVTGLLIGLFTGDTLAQRPGKPGQRAGRRSIRQPDRLAVGDKAPDFTLKTRGGRAKVTLSDWQEKKPVALVFGSYT